MGSARTVKIRGQHPSSRWPLGPTDCTSGRVCEGGLGDLPSGATEPGDPSGPKHDEARSRRGAVIGPSIEHAAVMVETMFFERCDSCW